MSFDFLGSYFWNWWSIPYWISFITSLFVFILLIAKKREGTVKLFIVAAFLVTINTLVSSLATNSLDPDLWLNFIKITVITGPLAITFIFHFSYAVLSKNHSIKETIIDHKRILIIYPIPIVLITTVIIYPELYWSGTILLSEYSTYGIFGTKKPRYPFFWTFYNFYQGVMLFLVALNFYRIYRQTTGLERRQSEYFIFAILVQAIALFITGFLQYLDIFVNLELSTVTISIAMLIITIGILKAQLFDIELIVSQSVKYALLNIGMAWVFVISREIMTPLISEIIFRGSQVATLISGFIVITVIAPIKNFTSKLTEKLFPMVNRRQSSIDNKLKVYKTQLEYIWSDGKVTTKEKTTLDALRQSLGISLEEHEQLEQEVYNIREKSH